MDHLTTQFLAQPGGENMARVLNEQRHLVTDDLHVAVWAGQGGLAGAITDRHHYHVALFHPHDGLLRRPHVEQAGEPLAKAIDAACHRGEMLSAVVRQAVGGDKHQAVGRDDHGIGDTRHLGDEVVDEPRQRACFVAQRTHAPSLSPASADAPPAGLPVSVPAAGPRLESSWRSPGPGLAGPDISLRAARWPSWNSERSSRIRSASDSMAGSSPAETGTLSPRSSGAGMPLAADRAPGLRFGSPAGSAGSNLRTG